MKPPTIHLHIEELHLIGFPATDRHHIGDAAAQAAIALRAMGDARAAGPEHLDFLGIEFHQMGEPHVWPQPLLLGTERHW